MCMLKIIDIPTLNFMSIHSHGKRLYGHYVRYCRYCLQFLKSIDRLLISSGIFQYKRKQFLCNLKCIYYVFTLCDSILARRNFSVLFTAKPVTLKSSLSHFLKRKWSLPESIQPGKLFILVPPWIFFLHFITKHKSKRTIIFVSFSSV